MATAVNAATTESQPTAVSAASTGESRPRPTPAKKVKVTLSLTEGQYEALVRLAAEHELTLSQLVTRGVALQEFLLENRDAKLLLKRGDSTSEVVLVS